jgi:ubiquinone/menaquinone biosynthesis C-methylase UbiE
MDSPTNSPYTWLRTTYDRNAHHYDEQRYVSAEGRFFNEFEGNIVQEWLDLTPSSTALDMPAGTGRLSVAMAASGARVVGLDISRNMLGVAADKKRTSEAKRMHLAQGSGAQLPFADNTFDAVISFKFFHLIPNDLKPIMIREMVRVLKPGKPLVIEFNSPFYGGVLAFFRYYFRKRHPGGMRMKCVFPDQIPVLFRGLEITRKQGVKLPFSGAAAKLFGQSFMERVNIAFGKIPGARYLSYTIIIEARKTA